MKNTRLAVAIAAAFFAFACENQQNERTEQTTIPDPMTPTPQPMENTISISPEEFTQKAYESNLKEVELAELATKKANDVEVKIFARTAMKEHKKANRLLEPIAKNKNIEVPSTLPENEMKDISKLKEKSGTDFSKEYMEKVVDMHEEDVDLYTRASENLQDTALSNYARQMLPDLQKHLEQAKNIQKKMEEKPASVK